MGLNNLFDQEVIQSSLQRTMANGRFPELKAKWQLNTSFNLGDLEKEKLTLDKDFGLELKEETDKLSQQLDAKKTEKPKEVPDSARQQQQSPSYYVQQQIRQVFNNPKQNENAKPQAPK